MTAVVIDEHAFQADVIVVRVIGQRYVPYRLGSGSGCVGNRSRQRVRGHDGLLIYVKRSVGQAAQSLDEKRGIVRRVATRCDSVPRNHDTVVTCRTSSTWRLARGTALRCLDAQYVSRAETFGEHLIIESNAAAAMIVLDWSH
jgi:hypothetical protein